MISILKRFFKYFLYFVLFSSILITIIITYFIWFQPAFYFPKPTGNYSVGVKDFHWIDKNRKETFSNNSEHPNRELMIKIWYPTQGKLPEKPTTPYAPDLVNYYKKNYHFIWLFGFSRPIYSYVKKDTIFSNDKSEYPIIIFTPGYGGRNDSNSFHCEELASHGYIVVGISPTYEDNIVQFQDGRIANGKKVCKTKNNKNKSFVERRKEGKKEIEIRVADVKFVLDQLEQLNKDKKSIFYQHLDQDNTAIFGQSMGGEVAAQLCQRDSRIKAGVDMDGSLIHLDLEKAFNKPFMFLLAGDSVAMLDKPKMDYDDWKKFHVTSAKEEDMLKEKYLAAFKTLAQKNSQNTYIFIIENAGHIDFTNLALLKEASIISKQLIRIVAGPLTIGSIDGYKATDIINTYLLNFFDKYLKNKSSETLEKIRIEK
ncbi:hypothetical protein GF322_02275 [Candidatus Dependentiae bacterium]|nr:hypothetical protein [Candidatus Dependentiae bacterium]